MRRSRRIVGTPEWEQELLDHVEGHGRVEGELLEEYRELASDDDLSPAFRYLAAMILDDEVRHHRVFDDLAKTVRAMVAGDPDTSGVPSLHGFHDDRFRIEAVTERLLVEEREDRRQLKDLAKRLKEFEHTTLWGLLVELMICDTEKHIRILEFVRDRAKDQPD